MAVVDLQGTDLHRPHLSGSDLRHATLVNACLRNGTDLPGAKLTRVRYDARTKWPEGFDPVAAGAVLVE